MEILNKFTKNSIVAIALSLKSQKYNLVMPIRLSGLPQLALTNAHYELYP